jgi:mitogen-activated protein kinase kinase kinase
LERGVEREDANVGDDIDRNPTERPTADMLLSQHPFCDLDTNYPNYNFFDTELYAKIRGTY